MSVTAIAGAVTGLTNLASEFIEDPDKRNEFMLRSQEMNNTLLVTLVQQETTPWVDALVKLITAIVQLHRPIASIAAFAYSAVNPEYLAVLQQIDPTLALIAGSAAFGSAPGWFVSRHIEKTAKAKNPTWEH